MKVLILGGTTEASAIARALAGDARFSPVLSLAGRTRAPVPPPVPWRVGGFGGVAGLAAYLRRERMEALIDATHPFAARMKANAAAASGASRASRCCGRPGCRRRATGGPTCGHGGGRGRARAAPRRVFLTVGQGELAPFGPPHRYVVRSVDPPATRRPARRRHRARAVQPRPTSWR